ncbi:cytochrome P450 [Paraburkholderia phymatum]|uniref:Cytochrome P450 n=1 Tax=Paraburkholderia phymatum (strain DSM 17167 / CIP 108236 / LMG 21445 / STM815) TaxID=391038 RepID=B2JWL2_PARP8|nr:cytochrome P450 [Paraburkholderia phymatum]ACC75339.1 cytochrome P450 [Paraburkholderia phymatum STM815]
MYNVADSSRSASPTLPAAGFSPSYDPLIPHPEHVKDPYRVYAELRSNAPLYRSPHGVWIASGYEEVSTMLKSPDFGRGYFYFDNMAKRLGEAMVSQPVYASAREMMVMKDGPDHLRLRGLVAHFFSHRNVEALRPFMRSVMEGLIDKALEKSSFDVMTDIAFPLPSAVICRLVGLPEADWPRFRQRSTNGSRALEPAPLSPLELAEQNHAVEEARDYFSWLIELRKREPGDDLATLLVNAEAAGQASREEVIENLRMMFVGGQETTVNTIGNGLLALHRHPDQLQALKSDRALIPDAVTEIVRYDSAVQITPRQARCDMEMCGAAITAGDTILCVVASANRDERAWVQADRFDISRKRNYPLSFGGGPHYCLGAQLGMVETEVALAALLDRMPNLALDIADPRWLPGTVVFRGLQSLPAHA